MNAASLAELKRRILPEKVELYLVLGAILAAGIYASFYVFALSYQIGLLMTAALVAPLVAWLGGLRLCLPLYFTTMFGAQLVVPGLPVSINKGFAALMLLAFVFDLCRHRIKWHISMALVVYLLLQTYIVIASILLRPEGGDFPIQVGFYLVPLLAIWLLFWRDDWMRWLMRAFVLATIAGVILPGLVELVAGVNVTVGGLRPSVGRIDGISVNAIVFGLNVIWTIPFAAALLLSEKNVAWKALLIATLALSVILAIATGNRQTPIIMAVQMAAFLVLMRHPWKPWIVGIAVAGAVALAPIFAVKLWDRFSTAADPMNDLSLAFRRDKIVIAGDIIREYPLFGVGHDHFKSVWYFHKPIGELIYMADDWRPAYIDMGYVQIQTEYGLVGSLAFLLMTACLIFFFLRHYFISREEKSIWHSNMMAAAGAGFAQFYVANFISDAFMSPRMFLLFGILFATASAVALERDKRAAMETSIAA